MADDEAQARVRHAEPVAVEERGLEERGEQHPLVIPSPLDPPPGGRFHKSGRLVACHLYPPGTDGSRLITAAEVVARTDRLTSGTSAPAASTADPSAALAVE